MLPRLLRLSRKGFEQNRGLLRISSPHFVISYGPAQGEGGTGIIVPKKVIKGAVARHLLKRRIRTIVSPWSTKDRILIISARKDAHALPYQELEHELSSAFSSIINR